MKRYIGVLLLAVLTLTGCSAIDSGEITKKEFTPSYTYTSIMCASYSAKGICTVWLPITNRVADRWKFDLKARDKTGWVNVSQATYDAYRVGDVYHSPKKE